MPSIETAMKFVEKAKTAEERKIALQWLKKAVSDKKSSTTRKTTRKKKSK